MAIPSKQIGWSNEANLLWYVAKELEQIKGQLNRLSPTTTTTTTVPSITVGISPFSNCGGIVQTLSVVLTGDFCALGAPYPTITGDFSGFQQAEIYVLYNGQSRAFSLISSTLAEAYGGAPGECATCP